MKKKKVLIINPPLNKMEAVYSAVPLLLGQIKDLNVSSKSLDLNIEFLYDIISKKYLKQVETKIKNIYKKNQKIISSSADSFKASEHNKLIEKLYFNEQKLFKKLLKMADYLIPTYMKYIKDKKSNKNLALIKKYIQYAVKLCFLPYYPARVSTTVSKAIVIFADNLYKYSYEDIIEKVEDREHNIFVEYFEYKIKQLNLKQYDLIAITIPFAHTLYPALTLSKLLKEKTKANIVIGGILVHSTKEAYIKRPEMFGKFFDAIMYGEGEIPFKNYISYINNEILISQVGGLIYKENNEIKISPPKEISHIDEIKNYCFDGIDFSKYPEPFIAVEFSKGCYWGKCSYCYSKYQKKYHIRNYIKAADYIQELTEKYKVYNFNILDDSLNPNFAEKFAEEIIRRKLKISFQCLMRLEKNISYDLLKKMKEAGLESIFWGVESASPRIIELMNKGTDINDVSRILKDSYNAGIKNNLGIMFGFPTETEEDVKMTIDFIRENYQYIGKLNPFKFTLLKYSALLEKPDYYQISNIRDVEEFSNYLEYDAPCVSDEWLNNELEKNHLFLLQIYTKWN